MSWPVADNRSIFCRRLRGEEGGIRGVVGAVEGDLEGVGVSETTGVSDLIVDVDGLCFSSGEAVVGVVGGIKGPGTIGVDGQTSNASGGSIDGDAIRASDGGRSEGEGGGFGMNRQQPSCQCQSMSADRRWRCCPLR